MSKKIDSDEFQRLRKVSKNANKPTWTGWRYAALWGGLVGAIALTLYPIAIEPILNPQKYKEIQKQTRSSKYFILCCTYRLSADSRDVYVIDDRVRQLILS